MPTGLVPAVLDRVRTRADTWPVLIAIVDANSAAIDVTGFSYTLTVDPEPDPVDATNNLFSQAGTLSTPLSGFVDFPMADPGPGATVPGCYFYDIEQTDTGGEIVTIQKGEWVVEQDVTK